MKRATLFLLLTFLFFGAMAQNREAMKKIESARIALITERLGLSPEQAEKFWPVYRQYNVERRQIREEFRNTRRNVDMANLTEEQSQDIIKKSMDLKQRELNLDKEYAKRLTEVISTQQLFKLKNAEKDFQQMLLKRIQQQRQQRDQNQKMMQRREMMRDRINN